MSRTLSVPHVACPSVMTSIKLGGGLTTRGRGGRRGEEVGKKAETPEEHQECPQLAFSFQRSVHCQLAPHLLCGASSGGPSLGERRCGTSSSGEKTSLTLFSWFGGLGVDFPP